MKGKRHDLDHEVLRAHVAAELQTSKALWETSGKPASGNYKFRYITQGEKSEIRLTVYVRNNTFDDIEPDRGVQLTGRDIVRLMAWNLTVEGLFAEIESGVQAPCVPYVKFDKNKGFPRKLIATCDAYQYTIDILEAQ